MNKILAIAALAAAALSACGGSSSNTDADTMTADEVQEMAEDAGITQHPFEWYETGVIVSEDARQVFCDLGKEAGPVGVAAVFTGDTADAERFLLLYVEHCA